MTLRQSRAAMIGALLATTWIASAPVQASPAQKRASQASKTVVKKARLSRAKAAERNEARAIERDSNHADGPLLKSSAFLVQDQASGDVIAARNSESVQPIASITKLMTAMVALDATPSLQEELTVSAEDVDQIKGTSSRLRVGAKLTREEMLRLALMSSENRAASALSRHYPGGKQAFIAAMNAKARQLGLDHTHFADPTGLTAANVSTPRDLASMVNAAYQYPLIREFTTTAGDTVRVSGRNMAFHNTNSLVKSPQWEIGLSKTGYIAEAGKCLVMQVWLDSKPMIIVLLDSWGKKTRIGDANRIKRWLEKSALRAQSDGARTG